RHWHEMAPLQGDHCGSTAGHEIFRRAVPKVSCVLHVKRNRIRASQLVSDVLRHDGPLDAETLEPLGDLCLEDFADVDFGDAKMPVSVALDFVQPGEVVRV